VEDQSAILAEDYVPPHILLRNREFLVKPVVYGAKDAKLQVNGRKVIQCQKGDFMMATSCGCSKGAIAEAIISQDSTFTCSCNDGGEPEGVYASCLRFADPDKATLAESFGDMLAVDAYLKKIREEYIQHLRKRAVAADPDSDSEE
jgi:hypothetical protein